MTDLRNYHGYLVPYLKTMVAMADRGCSCAEIADAVWRKGARPSSHITGKLWQIAGLQPLVSYALRRIEHPRLVTLKHSRRSERNTAIYDDHKRGVLSNAELARRHHLSRSRIGQIITECERKEQKPRRLSYTEAHYLSAVCSWLIDEIVLGNIIGL
jgi:hypothetical protein